MAGRRNHSWVGWLVGVVVVLVVMMMGCSNIALPPDTSTIESSVASDTPVVTSSSPDLPPPWDPGYTATFTSITDAEAMRLRDTYLKSIAKSQDISNPPAVALVRWTSQFDWGQTIAQCLQDAGFNIVGVGSVFSAPDGIGEAQMSAFNLADYICESKYTKNPRYCQTLTESQWGMEYDYNVQWMVACVAALGVTASPPPTRDTYIAEGLQKGSVTWEPWSQAQYVFSQKSWDDQVMFMTTCPADPPNEFMWGG